MMSAVALILNITDKKCWLLISPVLSVPSIIT